MKVAMQHVVPHVLVLRSGLAKCFSTGPRALRAWYASPAPALQFATALRHPSTSFTGLEEQIVSSSSPRIRSFSLDQLRNSKIQTAPNAVAEAESKEEDGHKAEGYPPLIDAVDATPKVLVRQREVGAFQQLPVVSPGYEILGTALRRAKMVRPTKRDSECCERERNRGAKQLDALTKELSMPLGAYVKKFPECKQLHPYEQALLELTLGPGVYEETLLRVDLLRKRILDYGKNCTSICAKSTTKREAGDRLDEGFLRLEEMFKKHVKAIDDLKEIAKVLRAMPVVHPRTPTLCLVGAPNVGKSSLVRVLSSGKPEVCNYPFTTRGISMGHFFVDTQRYQVTDTPGLLKRPDEERNNIEKLALAALAHLPTAVLYVHDLTGECGTSVPDQFAIYSHIKQRFSERPWLDAISKADLLPTQPAPSEVPDEAVQQYATSGPAGALRVSVQTGQGLDELVQSVHALLAGHSATLHGERGDNLPQKMPSVAEERPEAFYSPAWPHVQG